MMLGACWRSMLTTLDNGTIDAGPVDLHLGMLAATFGDDARSRTHLDAAAQQCADIDAPAWGVHVDRWLARIA